MFSTPFAFMASGGPPPPPPPPVVQCFTSNGTWSCCTGTTCIEVIAIGAGGGAGAGGRVPDFCNTGNVTAAGGVGGGQGGKSFCLITSGFGSTQCVIIGAGGAGGIGTPNTIGRCNGCPGSAGGATCFGALVCAGGGGLGCGGPVFGQQFTGSGNFCPSAGGVGNLQNGSAGQGPRLSGLTSACMTAGQPACGGGGGGGSVIQFNGVGCCGTGGVASTFCLINTGAGGNGTAAGTSTPGLAGAVPGAGGGGGGGNTRLTLCGGAGGAGAAGIIQVTQFFT